MKFAIVNHSADPIITPDVLELIADALHTQLLNDVCPEWGGDAAVRVAASCNDVAADEVNVAIFDDADAPGALGYHDRDPNGHPYLKVFWGPIRDNAGSLMSGSLSLSAVLSHELCETMGDPPANFWADRGDGTEEALELCDRVEDTYYQTEGVSVSNWLLRSAFDPGASAPYDHVGVLQNATDVTPGGYVILRDVGGQQQPGPRTTGMPHPARTAAKGGRRHHRGVR